MDLAAFDAVSRSADVSNTVADYCNVLTYCILSVSWRTTRSGSAMVARDFRRSSRRIARGAPVVAL